MVYAQDDFPQCALYASARPGSTLCRQQQQRVEALADERGSPVFPFAFTIDKEPESRQARASGALEQGSDDSEGDGDGEMRGEGGGEGLLEVRWRRDGQGERRGGVESRGTGLCLQPLDYGQRASDLQGL